MDMTDGRGDRVDQLFAAALDLEPGARERFLEAECGDAEIRREVAALLKSSEGADPFFAALADRIGAPRGGLGDVASSEGRQLGPYRLVREVGRGGMGAVYLAERIDGQFEQRVAIKLLPMGLSTDAARRRFLAERRFLARLEHPGIARLLDGGVAEDDTPFFVMEYVEGEPIDRYCDRSRLSIAARLALFRQVCCAVRYAHRNLLVHRDLKPNNILVSAPASGDAGGTVKLLDFGIAKFLGAETAGEPTELTRLGGSPLTPTYASPEQLKGEAVTTASDVYALGALLYRLLCGRSPHPLKGCTPAAAEHIVCERNPPPPSAAVRREPNGDETEDDGSPATARTLAAARGTGPERLARRLRGDLDTIVLKALRKEPERRYASAGDLADDIERYLTGRPVAARPDTHGYRLRKFMGRNRAVVVAATLLIATGLAALFLHTERLEAERDAARVEAERAEAVTGFLMDMFEDAGTSGARDTLSVGRLLDLGEERLISRTGADPLVRIELLEALGTAYLRTGLDRHGRRIDEIRVAAVRDHYGPNHLRTAAALVELGLRMVGDRYWNPGIEVLEEGLAIVRAGPEEDHPAGARPTPDLQSTLRSALNGLLIAYREVGRVDEAMEVVREYLELRGEARSGDASDEEMEHDLAALAFVLRGQERFEEAAELYEVAIRHGRAREEGVEAATLNNYASLLRAMGRLEEAEPLLRESREIDWPAEGEEPSTFLDTVIINLLTLLALLERHEDALAVAMESHILYEATLSPGHWRVGRSVRHVGMAYRDASECQLAEPHLKEATEIYSKGLGPDHSWTATARTLLASCLLDLGRLEEAEHALLESFPVVTAGPPGDTLILLLEELVRVSDALERSEGSVRYRSLLAEARDL